MYTEGTVHIYVFEARRVLLRCGTVIEQDNRSPFTLNMLLQSVVRRGKMFSM